MGRGRNIEALRGSPFFWIKLGSRRRVIVIADHWRDFSRTRETRLACWEPAPTPYARSLGSACCPKTGACWCSMGHRSGELV